MRRAAITEQPPPSSHHRAATTGPPLVERGHEGFYAQNMFTPMELDDATYRMKPMNCPFHILIYKNAPDPAKLKGLRDRAMPALLLGCGLRRSELLALEVSWSTLSEHSELPRIRSF
jgi:site-specific recombinase XerD